LGGLAVISCAVSRASEGEGLVLSVEGLMEQVSKGWQDGAPMVVLRAKKDSPLPVRAGANLVWTYFFFAVFAAGFAAFFTAFFAGAFAATFFAIGPLLQWICI